MVGGSGSIGIILGYSVAGSNGSVDSMYLNSLSVDTDGVILWGWTYI
jgi:hypothetical protein